MPRMPGARWARDACFASLRRLHRLRVLALTRVTPAVAKQVRCMPRMPGARWARDACFASLRRLHRLRVLALTRVAPRW
ncbi:hypothetical protein, partial [Kribbella sp. NPDC023855]|uniref:hypothetical protein n=1 Tax=Kribbella sp. NPDC023855 TaxID=3154698 RepID=UPI0033D6B582